LKGYDQASKIKLIKLVKDVTGSGLKESKALVEESEKGPVVLFSRIQKDKYQEAFDKMQALGGVVEFE
jgi:large subunit ribosomal protein L7/L12